jgi:hypothetical protein
MFLAVLVSQRHEGTGAAPGVEEWKQFVSLRAYRSPETWKLNCSPYHAESYVLVNIL